ncbi:hypothetical protein LZ023_37985 (plasmid) [Pseudomonas silvicola]|nr:hypothetical protein LZ023_37985 [Pseudomonas silvicola]
MFMFMLMFVLMLMLMLMLVQMLIAASPGLHHYHHAERGNKQRAGSRYQRLVLLDRRLSG